MTRHHNHHYLGFAATQWGLFEKESPPRVKPLLYVYRVLLTGIHLMRTGRVEASLPALNDDFRLPYIPELIDRKIHGAEEGTLESKETEFHRREYMSLIAQLEAEAAQSHFPEEPTGLPIREARRGQICAFLITLSAIGTAACLIMKGTMQQARR